LREKDKMNKIIDVIATFSLFVSIALLCLVIAVIVLDDRPARSELYAECLETDYDKYECYAMIYGDK
jgi:hypothetical protein